MTDHSKPPTAVGERSTAAPNDSSSPDCPFCAIASQYQPISPSSESRSEWDPDKLTPPSYVLLSTPNVVAFLDIAPLTRGHVLVAPRRHRVKMGDLRPDEMAEIGRLLPLLARSVIKTVLPDIPHAEADYNVVQNNGPGAAQVIPHVHFHIVPRPPLDYQPPSPTKQANPSSRYPQSELPTGIRRSSIQFGRGMRQELDDEEAGILVQQLRQTIRQEWTREFGVSDSGISSSSRSSQSDTAMELSIPLNNPTSSQPPDPESTAQGTRNMDISVPINTSTSSPPKTESTPNNNAMDLSVPLNNPSQSSPSLSSSADKGTREMDISVPINISTSTSTSTSASPPPNSESTPNNNAMDLSVPLNNPSQSPPSPSSSSSSSPNKGTKEMDLSVPINNDNDNDTDSNKNGFTGSAEDAAWIEGSGGLVRNLERRGGIVRGGYDDQDHEAKKKNKNKKTSKL